MGFTAPEGWVISFALGEAVWAGKATLNDQRGVFCKHFFLMLGVL